MVTNAVSRQNSVCLGSLLSMRSFAIDEPGSPVRALYATLNSTNSGYDSLVLSVIFTKNKKNICIFIGPTSYNCLALVSFSRSLPFFNFSRSCQKLVKVVHTKKTIRASPCHSFHSFNSGKGSQKNRFFLGKSPKLWVGGGQES